MTLLKCSPPEARIIRSEPAIEVGRDVLYVPALGAWAEQRWGLYDHAGRSMSARCCVTAAADVSAEAAPPEDYVYGGFLERDTAGFLLETLPRFWSGVTQPQAGRRLVFHSREPLSSLFEVPVIASVMAALGITQADCVVFDRPVRLGSVAVPAASFERGRLAFGAYARLAATLGIRLSGSVPRPDGGRRPLHVSSARELVPVLAAEDAFDRALASLGVDVVHPGEMSFAALVGRVRGAPLVSSIARADAIDTALLACLFRKRATRMVLVVDGVPSVDTAIADALCGHDTTFMCGSRDDARALADAYGRSMQRLAGSRGLEVAIGGGAEPDLGAAAARCVDCDGQDASVLLDGLLTGSSQWRVGGRQYPWVDIEFSGVAAIRELRVHGPVAGNERPSALSLFGSFDGVDWTLLAERKGDGPFGGLDGDAHRFLAIPRPWQTRRLRLQSGTGVLSLDQIEIFGVLDAG